MISKHFFFFFKEKKNDKIDAFYHMGHFVFNVSMISSKMSCSSIYVLFMSYQNLTWKCWDTTYVTSDCNFGNYCRVQYEASFFRKWRSQTYPKSLPKKKKERKKTTKSKNKKPKQTNQPNRQFSKSVKGDGGVFTLILKLFFVINLKLFYMLPKWWEELLQYLMFYM